MTEDRAWTDEEIGSYIAEMSKALGLTIALEYKTNIVMFLRLAAEMAGTLDHADVDAADADVAPVFRLPLPGTDD